jgi:hypothetical protein
MFGNREVCIRLSSGINNSALRSMARDADSVKRIVGCSCVSQEMSKTSPLVKVNGALGRFRCEIGSCVINSEGDSVSSPNTI